MYSKKYSWLSNFETLFFQNVKGFATGKLEFVAIDEAQNLDKVLAGRFRRVPASDVSQGRSALGLLVAALVDDDCGVVLSGTGLNIVSAIELLASGVAKSAPIQVFGSTFTFDSASLTEVIRKRGYVEGAIDD